MYSTGRVAYSSEESRDVKIDSLYLDGTSGRIVASVDEKLLSLEAKSGHGLDIKIHTINRVQHHHTRLVPFYIATIGLALVWSSIRIFASGPLQMLTLVGGLGLIMGWAVTRKPTLTIDTEAGDCHVITGNDFALLKLNTILIKLQKGFSIAEAVDGLDILETDTDYPRNAILEEHEVPVDITAVSRPESIATFLASDVAESVAPEAEPLPALDLSIFDSQMPTMDSLPNNTPNWQQMTTEKRQRIQSVSGNSLIERGISNVNDRRNRQAEHPMSMFDKLDLAMPPESNHQHIPQNQPVITPGLLSHANPQPKNEAGPAKMPDVLPSFWNKDGYHQPTDEQDTISTSEYSGFNSPDTLLGNIDYDGNEVESLVANARMENAPNRALPSSEATPINQNSRLRKKTSPTNSRLVKRRRGNSSSTQRISRLVPTIGNAVRDLGSSITNRLINNLENSVNQNPSLRERADDAQQEELETYHNLAQSNGGVMPDEKARELEAIAKRRRTLIEQNEQEFAESDEDLSWTELVDTEAHNSSSAGKGGLPRIDL